MNANARVELVTPPSGDVVSLAEVKLYARVTTGEEDALLQAYVADAVRLLEDMTDRQLLVATFERVLSAFDDDDDERIELRPAPLREVASVKYLDPAGVEQTLDPEVYFILAPTGETCEAGAVRLAFGAQWPEVADHPEAVRIRFSAGYGEADNIPGRLKRAICAGVAEAYNARERAAVGDVIASFVQDFKLWRR
ncbi:MAG: phage head-tail connector protein [Vicinamibacteria bacterium]|nr:phage head-tail connector protein [Vicinamibacteria bacterium]